MSPLCLRRAKIGPSSLSSHHHAGPCPPPSRAQPIPITSVPRCKGSQLRRVGVFVTANGRAYHMAVGPEGNLGAQARGPGKGALTSAARKAPLALTHMRSHH